MEPAITIKNASKTLGRLAHELYRANNEKLQTHFSVVVPFPDAMSRRNTYRRELALNLPRPRWAANTFY
jgi:hypothetical protein